MRGTNTKLGVYFEAERLFVEAYLNVQSTKAARRIIDAVPGLLVQKTGIVLTTHDGYSRQLVFDNGHDGEDLCGRWAVNANRRSHECYLDALLPYGGFMALCKPGLTFEAISFSIVTYHYTSGALKNIRLLASGDICKPAPRLQCLTLHRHAG